MGKVSVEVQQGIDALFKFLGAGSRHLSPVSTLYGEEAAFNFPLPSDYTGVDRSLRISFPRDFPISPPTLIVTPSPWLQWPHTDTKGRLCLHSAGEPYPLGAPEHAISDSMSRLKRLLDFVEPTASEQDRIKEFNKEIVSYWDFQLLPLESGQALLITRPKESCPLFALTDPKFRSGLFAQNWFAEETDALQRFYSNSMGYTPSIRSASPLGFYFRLNTLPDLQIPKVQHVFEWLAPHISDEGKLQLEAWLYNSQKSYEKWLFLDIPDVLPSKVVGVWVGPIKFKGNTFIGLRGVNNHCRNELVGKHKLSLKKAPVQVLTYDAIHARDTQNALKGLQTKSVLLVGLGSLGSFVAQLLVKAGIGKLYFVDPDELVDANIGRHVLGMDSLGRSKVHALRDYFLRNTPGSEITAIQKRIQHVYTRINLSHVDAVVVTAASADSSYFLWEKKVQGESWSLLQAWAEPFVEVGHAIFSPKGCISDGRQFFTEQGRFIRKYTEWPHNGVISLPACGEGFISGGPISLNAIASMVASLTIKDLSGEAPPTPKWYSWIGDVNQIKRAGGVYNGPLVEDGCLQTIREQNWPLP